MRTYCAERLHPSTQGDAATDALPVGASGARIFVVAATATAASRLKHKAGLIGWATLREPYGSDLIVRAMRDAGLTDAPGIYVSYKPAAGYGAAPGRAWGLLMVDATARTVSRIGLVYYPGDPEPPVFVAGEPDEPIAYAQHLPASDPVFNDFPAGLAEAASGLDVQGTRTIVVVAGGSELVADSEPVRRQNAMAVLGRAGMCRVSGSHHLAELTGKDSVDALLEGRVLDPQQSTKVLALVKVAVQSDDEHERLAVFEVTRAAAGSTDPGDFTFRGFITMHAAGDCRWDHTVAPARGDVSRAALDLLRGLYERRLTDDLDGVISELLVLRDQLAASAERTDTDSLRNRRASSLSSAAVLLARVAESARVLEAFGELEN